MVSNPQHRLYLLESRALLLIPPAADGVNKDEKHMRKQGVSASVTFLLLFR